MPSSLDEPFTPHEIKDTVFALGTDKSPRPDEFPALFFHRSRYLLRGDLMWVVLAFQRGISLDSINNAFIVLIPKIEGRMKIIDYRPINCIVLAMLLKTILLFNVSFSRSTFFEGRYIHGSVLMVNKIVASTSRLHREYFLLKVDFKKAYDSIN